MHLLLAQFPFFRITGALLDRLTHHVNILEMNGESYRLAQSRARKAADAAKALKAAAKTNPHVPGLLLDRQPMPKTPPPYYAVGSKDEAVLYVLENRENWSAAKGALKWLAETA